MIISTYLTFNGQCKKAFEHYQSVLGGEIVMMMTYRDSPAAGQTAAEQLDTILHAHLSTGGFSLLGCDAPANYFSQPQGFSVSLGFEDFAKSESVFNALAENGSIKMPFQKTFWSAGFGMLVDQFGTPWMVGCQTAE
jgi:PhnB protein